MKKVVVISLGGSIIIPDEVHTTLLRDFKHILLNHRRHFKFVVVCGGGKTARNYIHGLEGESLFHKTHVQTNLGIMATRLNARFMMYFFGNYVNKTLPKDMKEVHDYLEKHSIVFCGALRYAKNQTSDATAAQLAHYLSSDLINLTDVAGLYDTDPHKDRHAKFISEMTHANFLKMTNTLSFKPGQHFVLDQKAAYIIKKHNIRTFILGSVRDFDYLLRGKHFIGTIIEG